MNDHFGGMFMDLDSSGQHSIAAGGTHVHVVWTDGSSVPFGAYVSSSLDGGASFGPSQRLDSGEGACSDVAVATSSDGLQVFTVWTSYRRLPEPSQHAVYSIQSRRSTDGGSTFGPILRLDSAGEDSTGGRGGPVVRFRSTEEVMAAWMDTRLPYWEYGVRCVYLCRSLDGGASFSHDWRADLVDGESGDPWLDPYEIDLALGDSETVFLAMEDGAAVEWYRLLVAASADGGTTFAPAMPVSPYSTNDEGCPSLGVSSDGIVHVMYLYWRHNMWEDIRQYRYARSLDGSVTFQPPLLIDVETVSGGFTAEPSLSVSGEAVAVAWGSGGDHVRTALSTDSGASFGAAVNVNDVFGVAVRFPNIALTDEGLIALAWNDFRAGSPSDVYADHRSLTTGIAEEASDRPISTDRLGALQSWPCPFDQSTTLNFRLPAGPVADGGTLPGGHVGLGELVICDLAGRVVRRLEVDAAGGQCQRVPWNGTDDRGRRVAPGAYFCSLRLGGQTLTGKTVVLR